MTLIDNPEKFIYNDSEWYEAFPIDDTIIMLMFNKFSKSDTLIFTFDEINKAWDEMDLDIEQIIVDGKQALRVSVYYKDNEG